MNKRLSRSKKLFTISSIKEVNSILFTDPSLVFSASVTLAPKNCRQIVLLDLLLNISITNGHLKATHFLGRAGSFWCRLYWFSIM